jgi:hypothetical protein
MDSLRAMFPIARTAGFSCFEGWKPIIVRLLRRLSLIVEELPSDERRAFAVVEIRQEFGTLTVYLSGAPRPRCRWQSMRLAKHRWSRAGCAVLPVPSPSDAAGHRSSADAHENWSRFDPRPAIPSP